MVLRSLWYGAVVVASSMTSLPTSAEAQATPRSFTLSAPTVVYDGEDGVIAVDPRTRVTPLPNGAVALIESGGTAVALVSRGSRTIRRIGRTGSGPGEYRAVRAVGYVNDTLWISDTQLRRVTYLPQYGEGKYETRPFNTVGRGAAIFAPAGISAAGVAVSESSGMQMAGTAGGPMRIPVVRTGSSGMPVRDTVAMLNVRNRVHTIRTGKGMTVALQPLSDSDLWAVSGNGAFVAYVRRSHERGMLGTATSTMVTLHDMAGPVRYTYQFPPPRPLQNADARAAIARRLTEMNAIRATVRVAPITPDMFARDAYIPPYWTDVEEAVVADDGRVVLRGNDWAGDSVPHVILTSAGIKAGVLMFPRSQRVRAIRGDQIWSTVEAEAGDVRVVVQTLSGRRLSP